jgi:hypothetical protein
MEGVGDPLLWWYPLVHFLDLLLPSIQARHSWGARIPTLGMHLDCSEPSVQLCEASGRGHPLRQFRRFRPRNGSVPKPPGQRQRRGQARKKRDQLAAWVQDALVSAVRPTRNAIRPGMQSYVFFP